MVLVALATKGNGLFEPSTGWTAPLTRSTVGSCRSNRAAGVCSQCRT